MARRGLILTAVVLAVGAAAGGWLAGKALFGPQAPPRPESPALPPVNEGVQPGDRRPDFRLQDLQGRQRSVSEWDGKVLAINFWATWCPPCRREIPAFMELQERYGEQGLQFVGIAIDDPERVREFAQTLEINYPILVGELDAVDVGTRYGNRMGALPYTVIVDRQGRLVLFKRGELEREQAEAVIGELL